ncbi:MAG: AbrB/MazE/SpoVT family DNA-binding domain-containing protein [Methanosarcinales archaeon]|uniref:AbrB/MazE/SpoVT family DNA-binding domain-containing protein n=1 Tax=Candidatus Ethanoperedens thermophilum TaxID=2766897 RepID=A0A848D907_9EURY|nr:AbrB/MazE/SpoVT family DNA-binding domain-containing protein [Candidatus Ethanoperedens thermophilum]
MKEEHIAQSKVTRRNQITIPKRVQDKLGKIKEGDYILFFERIGKYKYTSFFCY